MAKPKKTKSTFVKYEMDIKLLLLVIIIIAILYVMMSFIFFLNSNARTTVSEILAGMSISDPEHSDVDTTKPIKASDIDNYAAGIGDKVKGFNDSADFGKEAVSNQTLGL